MTAITAWRTDEPCPVCATGLILHDDGSTSIRAECRLCGWSDTWTSDQFLPADLERAEARQASQWLLAEYELTAAAHENWRNGCLADSAQEKRFLRNFSPGPMFTIKD